MMLIDGRILKWHLIFDFIRYSTFFKETVYYRLSVLSSLFSVLLKVVSLLYQKQVNYYKI